MIVFRLNAPGITNEHIVFSVKVKYCAYFFFHYVYIFFLKLGNLGRQYGDAMKFLDEEVRQKQTEKQWREHLR